MRVLVLNAGSGTVTATTYDHADADADSDSGERPVADRRAVLVHHRDPPELEVDGRVVPVPEHRDPRSAVLDAIGTEGVDAVGHRVVHGGPRTEHALIDDVVHDDIDHAGAFAPLHNPRALAYIDEARRRWPDVAHVACFDTVFHQTIPDAAAVYGGPRSWWDQGLRRRGFHGISHEDASRRVAALVGRDLAMVSVHCGGGVSAAAIEEGRSLDTTMGLTPAEGPIMAARAGSVDPGLLLHLLHRHQSVDELATVLWEGSGLLGLSGISGDEVELRRRRDDDAAAELAVAAYEHRLAAAVASMLPALSRFDALALTGGVLESDPELRASLCRSLRFSGLALDDAANRSWSPNDGDVRVSATESAVDVVLVPADEEAAIAVITAERTRQDG